MFLFSRPGQEFISNFIEQSSSSNLSYSETGLTKMDHPPKTYIVDDNRRELGNGFEVFDKAKQGIKQWKMFDLSWVELHSSKTPLIPENNVAVLIKHFGFYSLNNARIVYVIDEPFRFGFAYGTLEQHGEIGEERFMVEIDGKTGDVFYSLYALSRPGHFLAKLGFPFVRGLQKKFALDSMESMQRFVHQ